jgi:hypothetical protein
MVTFIAEPFPLFPFLHADLHASMLKQDPIDRIMGNMHPILLFDLLLKMRRSERILLMSGQDERFSLVRNLSGLCSRRLWIGIQAGLPIQGDNLVDPLPADAMIFCKIPNGSPSLPLTNDTPDITVGELTHSQI